MSFNIISFLKSSTANRGAVPVADDNPLPVTASVGGTAVSAAAPLPVTSQAFTSPVTLTRTADTTGYTAGDVIGINNAGSAGAAALTFSNMGPAAGGEVLITSSSFEVDLAAVPSGMTSFRLHLYNVTPPSALLDNQPWDLPSGDRASYLGYVDLGTPVDVGSTLYVETNGIGKQVTLLSGSVFAYLVTNGTYTPTSGEVYKPKLHAAGF